MKIKLFFFVFFLSIGLCSLCFSQATSNGKLLFDGLVYGYKHDPSKKFLQKEKQIVLEGTLPGVLINVTENGKYLYNTSTNIKGEFQLKLKFGQQYKIELSKSGYTKSILLIDLGMIPGEAAYSEIKFRGAEFILNSFVAKDTSLLNQPFGRLYFNTKGKFIDFQPGEIKNKKGILLRQEESNTPAYLMKRSVLKNKNNLKTATKNTQNNILQTNIKNSSSTDTVITHYVSPYVSRFALPPSKKIENFTEEDFNIRKSAIEEARKQLEKDKSNAVTAKDSLLIEARENLLDAAIDELESAKKIIELQKNEISSQKKLLGLAIGSLALLSGFLFVLYRHYNEKRKTNILLKVKNKKITDSINYARRIQQAILLPETEIKKLLPQSFIYYQPRDIVSGDFYWFAEKENKIIVAAVDCTGHGVPGAFMSLVGNNLLNEIINENNITEPSIILNQLHNGVLKTLHKDISETQNQDGMEMSICVIDYKNNIIEYSGAMNPVYVIKDNIITGFNPDIQVIGRKNNSHIKTDDVNFSSQYIPIQKGMCIYLFTDGYMDQFNGITDKKFNTSRFKKLLLDIQTMDMETQKLTIAQTIETWKGNSRQIDDMLIIGIKV